MELIEVESLHYYINTTLPTESPTSVAHKVLKRSGERLLAVDVDLLPANSSDISATIAVRDTHSYELSQYCRRFLLVQIHS